MAKTKAGENGDATRADRREVAMPCLDVKLVPRCRVLANTYNPNSVAPDRLDLLMRSILDNGFCFPIVTIHDPDRDAFVIIDGFHRRMLCDPEWLDIPMVPIVVLAHDIGQRMAATIQFNKARGSHQVDLDAEVIRALIDQGLAEDEIAAKVGLDLEAIHRYKQLTGIAELFKNADYSTSWEMVEVEGEGPTRC